MGDGWTDGRTGGGMIILPLWSSAPCLHNNWFLGKYKQSIYWNCHRGKSPEHQLPISATDVSMNTTCINKVVTTDNSHPYCPQPTLFSLFFKWFWPSEIFVWGFEAETDMLHATVPWQHIDGLVQERCNSSVLAMELRLSCTNPSKCFFGYHDL